MDPSNSYWLRYGAVMIFTDNDETNLIPLIINFFHYNYPSLLTKNYVMYSRAPITRIAKDNQIKLFYNDQEYSEWKTHMFTTQTYNNNFILNVLHYCYKSLFSHDYSNWTYKYYENNNFILNMLYYYCPVVFSQDYIIYYLAITKCNILYSNHSTWNETTKNIYSSLVHKYFTSSVQDNKYFRSLIQDIPKQGVPLQDLFDIYITPSSCPY